MGVKGDDNTKVTQNFDTQEKAIRKARKIAINQKSEVVIHGVNGKIRDKNSYGNDPSSSEGYSKVEATQLYIFCCVASTFKDYSNLLTFPMRCAVNYYEIKTDKHYDNQNRYQEIRTFY